MSRINRIVKAIALAAIAVAVLFTAWTFREHFLEQPKVTSAAPEAGSVDLAQRQTVLEISQRARDNLSLVSKPARPQTYWRTVVIPGEVADRPGLSDRNVTSPAVGVITAIHAYPGDILQPGEPMFSIRLFSEYLQVAQTQLFKARQETELIQAEIDRLSAAVSTGAVPRSKMIELQSEISRQSVLIEAARQELLTRGLTPEQVQQIESGTFVSTVDVIAPPAPEPSPLADLTASQEFKQVNFSQSSPQDQPIVYEVQELAVEMGQQVQAGQLLGNLSNHQRLYIVGHAFKSEAVFLERAAQERRPIEVEFADDEAASWPEQSQTFIIRHLANSIDTNSRTFDFYIPLSNQARSYGDSGRGFVVWRFRPGQRARIHVPVERFDDVFVLPAEAVVREGPEAYVFRQNGDLFKQLSVHVLHEDRRSIVIANDGSITAGAYFAQNSAASLNRVLKSQSASGAQPGMHVHADGTVHAAH